MEERSGVGVSVADRIGKDFQGLRQQLLSRVRSPAHALARPAPVESEDWGFASMPPFEELLHRAEQQQQRHESQVHDSRHQQQHPGSAPLTEAVADAAQELELERSEQSLQQRPAQPNQAKPPLSSLFLEALCRSSAFSSPHCEGALANAFHVQDYFNGLAGSVCLPFVPEAQAEHVRGAIKKHINAAWSSEAVRCGVGCAKAGNHDEAVRYYNRALELSAENVDAFVARGAAQANQQQLREAAEDFKLALQLDPGSRNAACYLEAVHRRMAEMARDEERECPPVLPHSQAEPTDGAGHAGQRPGRAGAAESQEASKAGCEQQQVALDGHKERHDGKDPGSNRPAGSDARSGSATSGSGALDDSGSSSDGAPLRDEDIRRALEILSKARSKHKKHKSKSRKSKSRHKSASKKKKRRRSSS